MQAFFFIISKMSADTAALCCPICSQTGVFDSVKTLRDRLIHVSTNKILCPVCQEEVCGIDKLTIHLFSHVKLLKTKEYQEKDENCEIKGNNESKDLVQQKKSKTLVTKNKTSSASNNGPVKYVKIYPKLPVISLNAVPVIDISARTIEECGQTGEPIYVKTETSIVQTNTTCNICGLQFVDTNILRMHRCLIHNIDENSNQNFTRYHCHLCPKNFKMRGSLMVHLRVAHYGFLSGKCSSNNKEDETLGAATTDSLQNDNTFNSERNDNKQWQCDVCRKCFTTKYFLKKHKRLHTGETPYACTQCNKTFTFQQSYHKHLLYHNDEKPHTCSYCGRAFKELSTLHNHQRIHTGEKPFSCETCGKCFRQRVSYLVHRRIHTGAMPYKCTACEKNFRYKVSQRTHKCPAQPPGTVVRQAGDLVEKLKKKHGEPNKIHKKEQKENSSAKLFYTEVSESNAELVRTGAKLSLEDMVSDNFTLIDEVFNSQRTIHLDKSSDVSVSNILNIPPQTQEKEEKGVDIFNHDINELIEPLPVEEKNIPSPSEILRNLCLSNEEDYIGFLHESEEHKNFELYKDLNVFL